MIKFLKGLDFLDLLKCDYLYEKLIIYSKLITNSYNTSIAFSK